MRYVSQDHETRATPAARVVGPATPRGPSGSGGSRGGVRAAYCRAGGRSRAVEGRDWRVERTAGTQLAKLRAAAHTGGAGGEPQAAPRACGAAVGRATGPAWAAACLAACGASIGGQRG